MCPKEQAHYDLVELAAGMAFVFTRGEAVAELTLVAGRRDVGDEIERASLLFEID